jgi:hypothetical protein
MSLSHMMVCWFGMEITYKNAEIRPTTQLEMA